MAKKTTTKKKSGGSKVAVKASKTSKPAKTAKAAATKPAKSQAKTSKPAKSAKGGKGGKVNVAVTGGDKPKTSGLQLTQGTVARPSGKSNGRLTPKKIVAPVPAPRPVAKSNNNHDEEADIHVLTVEELRKVKSGLSKKDLDHYRVLLLEKRAELLGDVASLETDARNNTGGNLSNMPLHMADIGSDNYEQEFTLGLVESEAKLLREIDAALMRIKDGYYGVCIERGIPISKARLDVTPWARFCIEVAREHERRTGGRR